MKKKLNINFTALFFLLIYLLSSNPAVMFHQHQLNKVTYNNANPCEKTIYYAEKNHSCNHSQHLTKASEKCALCDNHTLSSHSIFTPDFRFLKAFDFTKYLTPDLILYFLPTSKTSNRGPPKV